MGKGESQRQMDQRDARVLREQGKLLDRIELRLIGRLIHVITTWKPLSPTRLRQVLSLAIPTGQPTSGKRTPWDDTHSELLSHGQYVGLDAANQDRIWRLLGQESRQTTPFGNPLRLDNFMRRVRRRAEDADLALPLQIG